jgi:hypothetical protein
MPRLKIAPARGGPSGPFLADPQEPSRFELGHRSRILSHVPFLHRRTHATASDPRALSVQPGRRVTAGGGRRAQWGCTRGVGPVSRARAAAPGDAQAFRAGRGKKLERLVVGFAVVKVDAMDNLEGNAALKKAFRGGVDSPSLEDVFE